MRGRVGQFVMPGGVGAEGQMLPGAIIPGTLSTHLERFHQPVYDRVNYAAAGAASLTFFSLGIGSTATLIRSGTAGSVAKTIRDTYMRNQGILPNIAWWAYSVYFILVPATVAPQNAATDDVLQDVQLLSTHAWVEFRTVDKLLYQFPLTVVCPFKAVAGGVATTRNDSNLVGAPFCSEAFDLTVLDPNTGVRVPMEFERNQGVTATMYFDGSPALTSTFDIMWVHDAEIERPS